VNVSLEFDASPKVISEIVQRLEGHPAQALLNMALLRSMKQAIYSGTHGIHYGLASTAYTHFTSPIRKYPDLVVHRLIRTALQQGGGHYKSSPKHRSDLEKELAAISDHCSVRERQASEAEREALRFKQVRLMLKHLGDEFDAKIVGMISSGIFAQLNDPFVEGMISAEAMTDDFYQYNETKMVFVGKRTRKIFRIGDAIRVRVVRADMEKRQIDFVLLT